MPGRPQDEFYVGYAPRAPAGIASRTRRTAVGLLVLAVPVALVLALGQHSFAPSVFEFGVEREFEGVIRAAPYPTLQIPRPGQAGSARLYSTYYLVGRGKFGAESDVGALDAVPVRLRGSLIYRDDMTMIEIAGGSVETLSGPEAARLASMPPPAVEELGEFELAGEIIDSKCFLGVMKPGHLKPHRACAARCISGGVPPVLAVRDADGRATYFLLVSSAGEPVNAEVLDLIAEPVEIRGRVVRHGDLLLLYSDPSTYRRR